MQREARRRSSGKREPGWRRREIRSERKKIGHQTHHYPASSNLLDPQVGSQGEEYPKNITQSQGTFCQGKQSAGSRQRVPVPPRPPALILSLLPSTHWPQPVQPPLPQVASQFTCPGVLEWGAEAARPTQGQDCSSGWGLGSLGFEASALTVGSSPDIFLSLTAGMRVPRPLGFCCYPSGLGAQESYIVP